MALGSANLQDALHCCRCLQEWSCDDLRHGCQTSRMVKAGEVVAVKKPPVTYSFKILKTIEQRVGAKLLPEIYENVTTPDQYELLEMNRISGFVDRARGTGRPTKKDRRQMDEFLNMEEI